MNFSIDDSAPLRLLALSAIIKIAQCVRYKWHLDITSEGMDVYRQWDDFAFFYCQNDYKIVNRPVFVIDVGRDD